jgi:hypothetical protein
MLYAKKVILKKLEDKVEKLKAPSIKEEIQEEIKEIVKHLNPKVKKRLKLL